jgi:hypothetical protein
MTMMISRLSTATAQLGLLLAVGLSIPSRSLGRRNVIHLEPLVHPRRASLSQCRLLTLDQPLSLCVGSCACSNALFLLLLPSMMLCSLSGRQLVPSWCQGKMSRRSACRTMRVACV